MEDCDHRECGSMCVHVPTLKSTPIVAVEDSESNWSSQYRISTADVKSASLLRRSCRESYALISQHH